MQSSAVKRIAKEAALLFSKTSEQNYFSSSRSLFALLKPNMSFSLSFALASFGIALGKSLASSYFKWTSKKTAFSPASGLAAASAIDFSRIDAQFDFGISDPRCMELQVFHLSESSWRVHMLDRLLSLDSSSVPLDKPLSAPMFHLGASLSLDPALLDALPFSATPPSSAFCPSSDSADFLIAFYSGFIMLWAIPGHISRRPSSFFMHVIFVVCFVFELASSLFGSLRRHVLTHIACPSI